MLTFFVALGVLSLVFIVLFNIEAYVESKSKSEDVEYSKQCLENLFTANK